MRVNFISSKYTGETRTIYVWSDNVSIMWGSETDDTIRELSGSKIIFESVELMDYKLHRVRLRRGYDGLLHKKATINPKNKNDDECLRWSTISALNYNEIMKKEFENIFKEI